MTLTQILKFRSNIRVTLSFLKQNLSVHLTTLLTIIQSKNHSYSKNAVNCELSLTANFISPLYHSKTYMSWK